LLIKEEKKVYITANIIPHNSEIERIPEYFKEVEELGVDAIIVSDPGVFSIAKEVVPEMEIHLSTQANNTNWASVKYWGSQGVKRVVLARELSLIEISEIRSKIPTEIELEAFVHGAMCISYSGRCLLSSYMAGRDSNKGDCAHPCRWKYSLVEETRPNEHFPVYENEKGTFIFNSKDLCTIELIPEIIKAGVKSLKIEGRMKSAYYVATVVKAYRDAIDAFYRDGENYQFDEKYLKEVKKVSHRDFTKGFFLNKTTSEDQIYDKSSYTRGYDFIGVVEDYDETTGFAKVEQRNRICVGDKVEILKPKGNFSKITIAEMKDEQGNNIEVAPHPQMKIQIKINESLEKYSILRREILK
jgi:putative protease